MHVDQREKDPRPVGEWEAAAPKEAEQLGIAALAPGAAAEGLLLEGVGLAAALAEDSPGLESAMHRGRYRTPKPA